MSSPEDRPTDCADEEGGLDCRQVFLRFDDFVDRALSGEELAQVQHHLEACSPCAQELGFTTDMITEMKAKLRRIRAPEALKNRLARMLSVEP